MVYMVCHLPSIYPSHVGIFIYHTYGSVMGYCTVKFGQSMMEKKLTTVESTLPRGPSSCGPFVPDLIKKSFLVGGWFTPLKNMKVNWDYYSQYMGK